MSFDVAWLEAIAGSASLTGPAEQGRRRSRGILPLESQSAMSMPEIGGGDAAGRAYHRSRALQLAHDRVDLHGF